jgi:hypothetical protein
MSWFHILHQVTGNTKVINCAEHEVTHTLNISQNLDEVTIKLTLKLLWLLIATVLKWIHNEE